MPWFFFAGSTIVSYPFFLGHHDFNSAPKSTTLPKPWQMYKNRSLQPPRLRKKNTFHVKNLWSWFFLGGVNPPNPQSKAFFSGALKIKIHAWLGRLWVPWCFPKRTHGNPASSGNIAGWRNGCIFPTKLIFQTLSGFTKGPYFLLEIKGISSQPELFKKFET